MRTGVQFEVSDEHSADGFRHIRSAPSLEQSTDRVPEHVEIGRIVHVRLYRERVRAPYERRAKRIFLLPCVPSREPADPTSFGSSEVMRSAFARMV